MRARLEERHRTEHARRRAEDYYRDEYHDAHSVVLRPTSAEFSRNFGRMRVRIVKTLPAPLMDGFEVRGMHPNRIYEVDDATGRYLVIAGYAVSVRGFRRR